jgi:glycosyltransferase involved in cell wall biosynthesis
MKLVYLANQRLPTEKAYGIQITAMCRAFAGHGMQVMLAAPVRRGRQGDDVIGYYGIKGAFRFVRVWGPDVHRDGMLGGLVFWAVQAVSALSLAVYAVANGADIAYCREEMTALMAVMTGRSTILELHSYSSRRRLLYMLLRVAGVRLVCITRTLANRMQRDGFSRERILVAPDGVDLESFRGLPERADARRRVHMPEMTPITLYAGHLYDWKGVGILAQAASRIDGVVAFVGGTEADIQRMKARYGHTPNIMFVGHRPHSEIPLWLRAADVLVLPNIKDNGISEHYTSPLKMFEYMASGTPMVASDLPSIREVLNEQNAMLVTPDDARALADGIRRSLQEERHARGLAEQAHRDIEQYTWEQRAQRIINFITGTA